MFDWLEEMIAKRWIRKQLCQGYDHRLTLLYVYIKECARQEYFEDNLPTLDFYLVERFGKTVNGCYTEEQVRENIARIGRILAREFDPRINSFVDTYLQMPTLKL